MKPETWVEFMPYEEAIWPLNYRVTEAWTSLGQRYWRYWRRVA